MINVFYAGCHNYVYYAVLHYAECRYAECHYAECRDTSSRYSYIIFMKSAIDFRGLCNKTFYGRISFRASVS